MRFGKMLATVCVLAFAAVACGKGPAQAALTAADEAVASAKTEGEKFVPDQFKALSDTAAQAKQKFDAGDYKAALEAAQGIPEQAKAVVDAAAAKKTELTNSWAAMEGSLPAMVGEIQKKIAELMAARKLPAGMDKAKVEEAKTSMDSATALWAEAGTAFQGGDILGAVAKATSVKETATKVMESLGMAPPAPAEAGAPTK